MKLFHYPTPDVKNYKVCTDPTLLKTLQKDIAEWSKYDSS